MYQSPPPTAEQLALREQIRAQYPYLIERGSMDKKISGMALGAKNVKRLLSHEFPGVKFGVSSEAYSGGCNINIRWDDFGEGPSTKEVDDLVEAKFASVRFDGMTDSTSYDQDPWRKEFRALFGSASYVSAQSYQLSPEEIANARAAALDSKTPTPPSRRRPGL